MICYDGWTGLLGSVRHGDSGVGAPCGRESGRWQHGLWPELVAVVGGASMLQASWHTPVCSLGVVMIPGVTTALLLGTVTDSLIASSGCGDYGSFSI
jgi:hypothetical protein